MPPASKAVASASAHAVKASARGKTGRAAALQVDASSSGSHEGLLDLMLADIDARIADVAQRTNLLMARAGLV